MSTVSNSVNSVNSFNSYSAVLPPSPMVFLYNKSVLNLYILSIHPSCLKGNFQYTPALEKIMAMALLRLVKNKTKSVKICNKIAGTGQKWPKFRTLHVKKVNCLEKSAPQPVGCD